MRLIKMSFLFASLAMLTSCLKSKNDIAGTRNDDGSIVISVAETEYIDQDNNLIGQDYRPFANFDFATPATEQVQFFTIHVAQARAKKISGSLKVTVTASPGVTGTPLPAGAITVQPVQIPAFSGSAMDFPVKFSINKAGLDPNDYYTVVFTLTAADQGIISENAKTVEVFLYPGKYYGRYTVQTTVTDPLNLVKIYQNTKPVLLDNLGYVPFYFPAFAPYRALVPDNNYLAFFDEYFTTLSGGSTQGLGMLVDNLSTGTTATRYVLMNPTYHINPGTGAVDGVFNTLTGANYNVTFTNQLANKIVITDNGKRTLEVSYDVTLTAPAATGTTSRVFHVEEKYAYHPMQVRALW